MKTVTWTLAAALILASSAAFSRIVTTDAGRMSGMYAYDDYGNGEILVHFETGLSECPRGVYLTPTAPGFESMRNMLVTAFAAEKPVRFQVYNNRFFAGSRAPRCEVDAVHLLNSEEPADALNYGQLQVSIEDAITNTQITPPQIDYGAIQASVEAALQTSPTINYAELQEAVRQGMSSGAARASTAICAGADIVSSGRCVHGTCSCEGETVSVSVGGTCTAVADGGSCTARGTTNVSGGNCQAACCTCR